MQFSKNSLDKPEKCMVGLTGFEPVTLRLSSACSNQLSYRPIDRFSNKLTSSWWS